MLTFDAAAFADDWSPPAGGGTLSGWYYRWATQGCVSRFFFCAREPGTAIEGQVNNRRLQTRAAKPSPRALLVSCRALRMKCARGVCR